MHMHRIAIALSLFVTLSAAQAATDLAGVVVDSHAKPIANAQVFVYTAFPRVGISSTCPYCYRDCGKHQAVDASGAYNLTGVDPTLVFDVLAIAEGYAPAFVRRVDPAKGPASITLASREATAPRLLISGVVLDPDGKTVVGASVTPHAYRTVEKMPNGNFRGSTAFGEIAGVDKLSITNAKGEFVLAVNDPQAKLDVLVTARSFAPHIEWRLIPGQPSHAIQLSEGATLTGHVVKDGKPLPGAQVVLVQQDHSSERWLGKLDIATNENGLFVLSNVAPHVTYVVTATSDGASSAKQPVTVGDDKTNVDAGTLTIGR
ncbi:MAG TPA: carboxypeptidase regulatory-like domain-containing protein [Thermoanaerobaculia bacterium]